MYSPGGILSTLAILMAIAGPCSNSPVAPNLQADARSEASGVEDDSIAAFWPVKGLRGTPVCAF